MFYVVNHDNLTSCLIMCDISDLKSTNFNFCIKKQIKLPAPYDFLHGVNDLYSKGRLLWTSLENEF